MNGFLVLGKEQSFDAILGLFEDNEAAVEHAEDATEADVEAAVVEQHAPTCPLFAQCVGIVEFVNGEPQPFELVKEFADATVLSDEE